MTHKRRQFGASGDQSGKRAGSQELGCVPEVGTLSSPLDWQLGAENRLKWYSEQGALRLRRLGDFLKSLVPREAVALGDRIAEQDSRKNFYG
ncbi:MAG: hypothetical protein ACK449_14965 [Planctomycetota bacterium]